MDDVRFEALEDRIKEVKSDVRYDIAELKDDIHRIESQVNVLIDMTARLDERGTNPSGGGASTKTATTISTVISAMVVGVLTAFGVGR